MLTDILLYIPNHHSLQIYVQPMDTDPLPVPQATTSAGASSLNVSSQSLSTEDAVTAKSDETPVLPMDTEVPPVPTPEAWHRILPPVRENSRLSLMIYDDYR